MWLPVQSMKNVAVLKEDGRGICPLFSFPPRGIRQLKSAQPREFALQGKKMLMPGCQPRGEGGWAQCELTHTNFSVDTVQQNSNLHAIHTKTFIFYLYSFSIAPVEGLCC